MDQFSSKNESAPFKLPEVQPDEKDAAQHFESAAKNTDEHSMSRAVEQNSISNALNSVAAQSTAPITIDPSVLQNGTTQTTSSAKKIVVTDNLRANDTDLIEKAWVVKAKAIVNKTKDDPHEQTNEIKKIRDDYQSKRFQTNSKIDKE